MSISSLWSDRFWLPADITWEDLYSRPNGEFIPMPRHLLMSVLCGVVLHTIRRVLELYVLEPLAEMHDLKDMVIRLEPNATLEAAFRRSRRPASKEIKSLSSELGWSERSVLSWFRKRRNSQKSTARKKFIEGGWYLVYYICAIAFGVVALRDKQYFWDTRLCWAGYPHQHVSTEIYWYYMISLGFYLSSIVTFFNDVKRKDLVEMLVHHLVTVWLLAFSWCVNFVRIGSLVLILHDVADPFIHLAKCCSYAGYKAWCDRFFFVLFILWFLTRLLAYPAWILRCSAVHSLEFFDFFGGYWMFNGFLFTLQVLHIVWYWFISRIAYQAVKYGELQHDTRSDSEMSATDSEGDCVSNGQSRKITQVKKML